MTSTQPVGSWSLGFLIGLPVTVVLLLVGVAVIGYGVHRHRRRGHAYLGEPPWIGYVIGGIAWIVVVLGVALSPLGFYPYEAEYHRWEPVTGTVSAVESRLLRAGEGMQEKFVVTLEGSGQEYGIEDTRAALVEVGDEITITCIRQWQYAGVDGYDCNWAGVAP